MYRYSLLAFCSSSFLNNKSANNVFWKKKGSDYDSLFFMSKMWESIDIRTLWATRSLLSKVHFFYIVYHFFFNIPKFAYLKIIYIQNLQIYLS